MCAASTPESARMIGYQIDGSRQYCGTDDDDISRAQAGSADQCIA